MYEEEEINPSDDPAEDLRNAEIDDAESDAVDADEIEHPEP